MLVFLNFKIIFFIYKRIKRGGILFGEGKKGEKKEKEGGKGKGERGKEKEGKRAEKGRENAGGLRSEVKREVKEQ